MVLLLCSQYAGTEHSREFTEFFGVEWLIKETYRKTNMYILMPLYVLVWVLGPVNWGIVYHKKTFTELVNLSISFYLRSVKKNPSTLCSCRSSCLISKLIQWLTLVRINQTDLVSSLRLPPCFQLSLWLTSWKIFAVHKIFLKWYLSL